MATISERKWAAEARCLVEISNAALENIRLATTAPPTQPATCAGRYAAASRQESPPKPASTKDTTGLKWPPDTGPNIKMMAKSPAAVAAAFSKSSSPVFPGESCWAAMPDPMTSAARKALPTNSAKSRRHRTTSFTPTPPAGRPLKSRQQHVAEQTVPEEASASAPAQHTPSPAIPDSTGASASTV